MKQFAVSSVDVFSPLIIIERGAGDAVFAQGCASSSTASLLQGDPVKLVDNFGILMSCNLSKSQDESGETLDGPGVADRAEHGVGRSPAERVAGQVGLPLGFGTAGWSEVEISPFCCRRCR